MTITYQPKYRQHECWACNHSWVALVRKGDTTNLSGELTEHCQLCGRRASMSGPHQDTSARQANNPTVRPAPSPVAPREMGICPICNGSGKQLLAPTTGRVIGRPPETRYYWPQYAERGWMECRNCGGQTMGGVASGRVYLRPDGTPCAHDFKGHNAGRCLSRYECSHCGDRYDIDSGD